MKAAYFGVFLFDEALNWTGTGKGDEGKGKRLLLELVNWSLHLHHLSRSKSATRRLLLSLARTSILQAPLAFSAMSRRGETLTSDI